MTLLGLQIDPFWPIPSKVDQLNLGPPFRARRPFWAILGHLGPRRPNRPIYRGLLWGSGPGPLRRPKGPFWAILGHFGLFTGGSCGGLATFTEAGA